MPDIALLHTTEPLGHLVSRLFAMGGPVMMALVVIAMTGVITFVYLMLLGIFYAPRLTRRLKKIMTIWQQTPARVNPRELQLRVGTYGRLNPLLRLVTSTMLACQQRQDREQIRKTVALDAQQALEPFEAPLKIIEVIAALAPLLGLLGTVMGMIEAFSTMAAAEGRANATQLSGGIYEALTTTAAGLVIAIPFAAIAAWIEFRLRRIHQTVNYTLITVLSVADSEEAFVSEPPSSVSPQTNSVQEDPGTANETARYDRQGLAHATG